MYEGTATEEAPLRLQLEVHLDRSPVTGALRTEAGAEEQFVGWLEFVGALDRLHRRLTANGRRARWEIW